MIGVVDRTTDTDGSGSRPVETADALQLKTGLKEPEVLKFTASVEDLVGHLGNDMSVDIPRAAREPEEVGVLLGGRTILLQNATGA